MSFQKVTEALTRRGYRVTLFETKEEATAYLSDTVKGCTVGFGGSVTLQEMGLYGRLSGENRVFWHWEIPPTSSRDEILTAAQTADVYVASVNGLSETGEIVQIDGTCNRVSAMLYGHKRVVFVVGRNKLAESLDAAIARARNVAAPLNAQRLARKTPCAAKGDRCYDCKSPERICRALTVLWEKPGGCDYEVVLVSEDLGY